ncbi:uncharacterized protein LOC127863504 [Dreissena polymorpha]|uniref:Uncharacterized protein n=1 Tax=Dreissena polymorpha TaxID=45954 RepID=A0A9D4BEB8_DREPO|nr:uncharacterized protein LOC127863504 [Dreissena polymorpha]XP_052259011.1 uncharacterized protein LOC127863504 [Dreissena polymorpha]KAH3691981.1 hypothetical protein DPMN_191396 [Dreissena polymorpha]
MMTALGFQQGYTCIYPHLPSIDLAPTFGSWDTSNATLIIATAPPLETATDDENGNRDTISTGSELIEKGKQGLANFLSSGDRTDLKLCRENVEYYLASANRLNHKQLENVCHKFIQECGMESDRRVCLVCQSLIDKRNSVNNNPNLYHKDTDLKVPRYQIMFPKDVNSNETEGYVLVLDIRSAREIQKIGVKKLTKFGTGFTACTAYVNKCPYVFVFGGSGKHEKSLFRYDVVENKWNRFAHLKNTHYKHIMAFVPLQKAVYVIGGKGCGVIEKCEVETGHCTELNTSLKISVHNASSAVYKDKIFIFGGKTIRNHVWSVQVVDTTKNTVSKLRDLPFDCSGGQAVVVKDKIYIAMENGEMIRYCPQSDQSETCAKQPYTRKHFSMFEKNGHLNIVGGVRTDGCLEHEGTMYTYCPDSDEWRATFTFTRALPIHTSCTIDFPKECPVTPFRKMFGYC